MDRAILSESIMGRAKNAAVLLLTLIVLVFALQPCFAAPFALRSHCCPSHAPKCHDSGETEFCAMGSMGFAPPEEFRPAVSLDAEAPLPEVSTTLTALAGYDANDSAWVPDRGRSYLLNSSLLV